MVRLRNLAGDGKFIEYPPNCLQFKALCLSFYEDLNLPNVSDAYRGITNSVYKNKKTWSHEVIEFIANKLPADFFKIEQEAQAYAVFKGIYSQVAHLLKQGHALPALIERKGLAVVRTPSVAMTHLQQIKQRIGATS